VMNNDTPAKVQDGGNTHARVFVTNDRNETGGENKPEGNMAKQPQRGSQRPLNRIVATYSLSLNDVKE
jgi:hypothetical protein